MKTFVCAMTQVTCDLRFIVCVFASVWIKIHSVADLFRYPREKLYRKSLIYRRVTSDNNKISPQYPTCRKRLLCNSRTFEKIAERHPPVMRLIFALYVRRTNELDIISFFFSKRAVGAWHITRNIRLARLKSGLEKPECVAVRNRRFSTDFLSPSAADR